MKKLMLCLVLSLVAAGVTGCTSLHTNDAAIAPSHISMPAVFQPIIEVGTGKVTGVATYTRFLGIFTSAPSFFADNVSINQNKDLNPFNYVVESVKSAAVYNACQGASCDVLLGTKYVVEANDYLFLQKITVTVTGFPGRITGVKEEKPVLKFEPLSIK